MSKIYSFNLEFQKETGEVPIFSSFPFIFNDRPVEGFNCRISSRFAGDMKSEAGIKNRLALFSNLGINPAAVYSLNQIHSRTVIAVDSEVPGNNPPLADAEHPTKFPADGMVTQDRSVTLSVTVADCLPVYLLDTKTGAFALVHSGWKGTGIVINAINLMKELFASNAGDITAVLGPCIGSCCYKVDADRSSLFEKEFGTESVRKSESDFFLDLKAANIKLLRDIGIKNIAVCQNCTYCDDRLGSFRREGKGFTHMLALINVCQ